jgi:hypothetical protein
MPKINTGSIDLNPRTAAWLKVAANINSESLRVRVAKIVDGHVKRFKPTYAADIKFLARQWDVTWEQMFLLLFQHAPPYTDTEVAWAKEQPPLIIWEEERTQFGIELPERPLSEQKTEMENEK